MKFCDHILNGDLKESHQIHNQLLKLLDLNADIRENHPQTGEPMAFLLLRMHFFFDANLVCKLKFIPSLFDLKNKEGLNLIQCLQKSDLEGRPLSGLAMQFSNLCPYTSPYLPYQSYVGGTFGNTHPDDNPFRFKANRDWADKLRQATTYSDASRLRSMCPDSGLLRLFEDKLCDLSPYHLFEKKSRFTWLFSLTSGWKKGKGKEKAESNKKWLDQFKVLIDKNEAGDLLDHIRKMPLCDILVSVYSHEYDFLQKAKSLLDPFKFKEYNFTSISSDLLRKESKWIDDLKKLNQKTILDVEEVRVHLEQIPNPAALRMGLEHLMKDAYAALFPEILSVLYADVEEFLMDEKTVLETGSLADMHPIYYALAVKESPKVAQQMMKFLGDENLQKFLKRSTNEEFSTILRDAPEETIECLFKATPSLFIHQDAQRDFFFISLTHLPMKLREEFLLSNIN